MSANVASGLYQYTSTGASVITFTPDVPTGASITAFVCQGLNAAATTGTMGSISQTIENLVDGNESGATVLNYTGQLTTTAVIQPIDYAWSSGSPDGPASVTVTLASAVPNNDIGYIQYFVSWD